MSEHDLTRTVRSLYEEFPFPNTEYQMPIRAFAAYFAQQPRRGGRSLLAEGVAVADFGCGTAAFLRQLAGSFPESRFTGVDMTSASLELARGYAAQASLANVELVQGDILSIDLQRRFDVVMNLGVLHHLADPPRGLERVAAHLAPDGFLVLWLYGKHGRMRLNLNQQMIALLQRPGDGWREQVELAKRVLRGLPPKLLECHFSVADQKLEDDFPRALEWVLQHDQWVADQFVHPVERTVDMDDILALLDGAGLELDAWLGVPEEPARWAGGDELVRERIERLSRRDRLRFIDRLVKPNYYFLVARFSAR